MSGKPRGAGTSSRTLQPTVFWNSGVSIQLCSSLAPSGCGALLRMAPIWGQLTKSASVGKATLVLLVDAKPAVVVKLAATGLSGAMRRVRGVAVPRTQRGLFAKRPSSQPFPSFRILFPGLQYSFAREPRPGTYTSSKANMTASSSLGHVRTSLSLYLGWANSSNVLKLEPGSFWLFQTFIQLKSSRPQ